MTSRSKIGSKLLLTSTSIQWVPMGKQCLSLCRRSPNLVPFIIRQGGKHITWRGTSGRLFGFTIGEPSDELRPFTKSSETGLS